MCGIVGYIGDRETEPILTDCLKRLEYRGYDSCGIAILGNKMQVFKDVGRIVELERHLPRVKGKIGIGHTRWATHGKPSKENAHPHLDCTGKIAVVHNGVITNFQTLREELTVQGHAFRSETDTEVIAHLIERYYEGDLVEAVGRALREIRGSYAVVVIGEGHDELVVARNENPLVIGLGDREILVASDIPAVLERTDKVIYLKDGDIGLLSKKGIKVFNNGAVAEREEHRIPWTLSEAQRGGYEHFILKEIHEQPGIINRIITEYISAAEPKVELGLNKNTDFSNILLLACGTSYHAALVGKYIIEKLAEIPVCVELASEFNYSEPLLRKNLSIAITQSGETADTVKALRKAKIYGRRTLAITNVVESSITRIADEVLYLRAGPEISVAATKSFIAQLVALYLLALSYGKPSVYSQGKMLDKLRELPSKVERVLTNEEEIAEYAKYLAKYDNAFLVARGINLPIALEGALKLKEISYIHAEGYPAGELKHGPLALVTSETPVVGVIAKDNTHDILLANIKEIKARDAPVLAVASEEDFEIEKYVDFVIRVPQSDPLLAPVVNTVALQLLAYYAAREKGCPIDMPRNLAKSITVE
jgi:glucosamine--fructose-6-phosphate aminotransferase (isomerizing)